MKNRGNLHIVLREVDPPTGLYHAVLARIARARQKHARTQALWLSVVSVLCTIALVPTLQYMGQELYTSGFYSYVSLIFSDSSLVLSVWQTFAFSLLESLPSIALLLVLCTTALLVWTLRKAFVHARIAFSY